MFFQNLESMKRYIDDILSMDANKIDGVLSEHP